MSFQRIQLPHDASVTCVVGEHEHSESGIVGVPAWYMEFDGSPICPDHFYEIANAWHWKGITEQDIKRLHIRSDERRRDEARVTQIRKGDTTSGWIYYIHIGDLIKIGYTANLQSRISSYPPNAVLRAVHPGTKTTERDIHSRFTERRVRGREWFRPGGVLDFHIEQVIEQFGAPHGIVKPMRHAERPGLPNYATMRVS